MKNQYDEKYNALLDSSAEVMSRIKFERTQGRLVFPESENVFRCLEVPVDEIRCVFVGMDPYPTYTKKNGKIIPEATGRSFEVASFKSWLKKTERASLRNILKALYYYKTGEVVSLPVVREKMKSKEFLLPPPTEWFDTMQAQGVVFLNASLTVEAGKPNSHQKLWAGFMQQYAELIVRLNKEAKWILAGKDAQNRFGDVVPKENQICCSHPRMAGFVTECPFKEVDIKWV